MSRRARFWYGFSVANGTLAVHYLVLHPNSKWIVVFVAAAVTSVFLAGQSGGSR